MSFSSEVKEEIAQNYCTSRHCQLAELAALLHFCGQYGADQNGDFWIGFQTENHHVVRKGFTYLKKTYNIEADMGLSSEKMEEVLSTIGDFNKPVNSMLLKNACCQRAFLKGAFLSVGSISDPEKWYHLEFVCVSEEKAMQLIECMRQFGIEAHMVQRKKYMVVYIKEASGIVDLLNVCEAHVSLMKLENLRILKEVRNSINRRVNCETANITKTVNAAARQIEDIIFLRDHYGFENLPENLREVAQIRLENQEATLKELGEMLQPPVGKSGINHRLRKLSELADNNRL